MSKRERGVFQFGGWNPVTWFYNRKETLWYVLLFVNPLLTLELIGASAKAVERFNTSGAFEYPEGYIAVALTVFAACALVPFLVKDSEPDLRFGAISLTGLAPALVTGYAWYRMLESVGG